MSMECDLCTKAFTSRRTPVCLSCATASLYITRLHLAQALLAREKAHNHVEALLRPGNDGVLAALSEDTDLETITAETQHHALRQSRATTQELRYNVEEVDLEVAELKDQVRDYKNQISRQRSEAVARRRDLASVRTQLATERTKALASVAAAIDKSRLRINKVAARTAEARVFLCHQAAMLLGLKRVRLDNQSPSEYWLSGVQIPNLRHICRPIPPDDKGAATKKTGTVRLNHLVTSHELQTASLESICHLLVLCCHYLSVRLPAEIVVPANGASKFVVMPERSSYKGRTTTSSLTSSTTTHSPLSRSKLGRATTSFRSRELYLDRPLSTLHNDDPKAFGLYIETIMLLAWNIAWLCRVQGVDTINTFEDVCAIGRNIYSLFMRGAVSLRRTSTAAPSISSTTGEKMSASDIPVLGVTAIEARLGVFSNSSVSHPVHGFQGQELIYTWRLGSPFALSRLTDKLLNYILSEMSRQEWDTIEEDEWDDQREDEQPVLVGGARKTAAGGLEPAMSVMSLAGDGLQIDPLSRGRNGWTKLRGRGEP